MAGLFVLGILVFAGARAALVPKTFGQYGHYRGSAVKELGALPVNFAGHQACTDCHSDKFEKKDAGRHKTVNCEACHGPQSKHAADPSTVPTKPDPAKLCVTCHEKVASKPRWFPQIDSKQHNEGISCETCHDPHSPKIEDAKDSKDAKGKKK
jgi:hypothetical protein